VNKIVPTAVAGGVLWSAGGASGAGTAVHVRPPSVVLRMTTVRQLGHGVASSQPADGDTKLADRTLSAPPDGAAVAPDSAAVPPDRAAVPPAVAGLAPAAGGAGRVGAWSQAAPVTSSAAVITKAGKTRAVRRRAVGEPTWVPIMSGPLSPVSGAPAGDPGALNT
jgi:hypothetical protein